MKEFDEQFAINDAQALDKVSKKPYKTISQAADFYVKSFPVLKELDPLPDSIDDSFNEHLNGDLFASQFIAIHIEGYPWQVDEEKNGEIIRNSFTIWQDMEMERFCTMNTDRTSRAEEIVENLTILDVYLYSKNKAKGYEKEAVGKFPGDWVHSNLRDKILRWNGYTHVLEQAAIYDISEQFRM